MILGCAGAIGVENRESELEDDELATKKCIISTKISHLSTAIREYRNLIHPGSSIRNKETPNSDSSNVVMSLVRIILDEVIRRQIKYGYTAEQLVSKIENDPSAKSISKHLVKGVNPKERERLVLNIIPRRYLEIEEKGFFDGSMEHLPSVLICLFRESLRVSNDQTKERAAQNFVKVLKEESERVVFAHGEAFFCMSDLQYLSTDEKELVKDHFFERVRGEYENITLIQSVLSGVATYLSEEDIPKFVDPLVRAICYGRSRDVAQERIEREYMCIEETNYGKKIIERLDEWSEHFSKEGQEGPCKIIRDLSLSLEIPF